MKFLEGKTEKGVFRQSVKKVNIKFSKYNILLY